MKYVKSFLPAIILIFSQFSSFAQFSCGFDVVRQNEIKNNPAFQKKIEQNEANIRQYIKAHTSQSAGRVSGVLYTVPLVVHVIHDGGAVGTPYNPTDNQIISAIDYLNLVYNGTAQEIDGAGDLQIQFVMAKRDPNCGSTNGINRVDGNLFDGYIANGISAGPGSSTSFQKLWDFVHWPPEDYLNIYLVNMISGGVNAGAFTVSNGIVLNMTVMEYGDKALPHEMGHMFGLYHVFEGITSTGCPPYSSTDPSVALTTGDCVADTDPIDFDHAAACGFSTINTCTIDAGNPTGNRHNKNTENNFMNYSGCYTLFTAGQKARMLASAATNPDLASLYVSLAGVPVSAAYPCVPGVPKINFDKVQTTQQEGGSAMADCRSYTDYTYSMIIAAGPSAAATAVLNVETGASATEGADFDIFTGGDFSTTSKTVVFPAGSTAAQPFTIRVYDDAIVEGTETFTLGFTLSNGGGDAVKSNGRTSFVFAISDNDQLPFSSTGTIESTGYGNTFLQLSQPFDLRNPKQQTQLLYTKYELQFMQAGNILGFAFFIVKNSSADAGYKNLSIRIAQTTQSSLYNFSNELPLKQELFTTVFTSNYYKTVDGLNTFTFSQPFVWDGVSGIVLEFCYDNGISFGSVSDYALGYPDNVSGNVNVSNLVMDCGADLGATNAVIGNTKPSIIFKWQQVITRPQIQTQLNSSKQEYLGPGADVYFYDAADNKLLARIKNTSSFDYGCTQVVVDRNETSSGVAAVPFLNNSPANYLLSKTLKVIPTVNNPAGGYEISLYYTNAETDAWKTATGQDINNMQIIKTTGRIADVTPVNPAGGGVITAATPVITQLGSNTVLTASFSNGFSGFGAGVAGIALPVRLLGFTGNIKQEAVILNWSTSFETNSKNFEIERSYDGLSFTKVGTVNAAGNSAAVRHYSFTDPSAPKENNYYRLKQVDLDDKSDYSKVILIRSQPDINFKVISNPFNNLIDIAFGKIQSGRVDIRLMDVTGKEIYHATGDATGQTKLSINLAGKNIGAGIYLLQVKTGKNQFIARVMKQ